MNANMTYDTVAFTATPARHRSFLTTLRRFFSALFKTNEETPCNLPNAAAARLYL